MQLQKIFFKLLQSLLLLYYDCIQLMVLKRCNLYPAESLLKILVLMIQQDFHGENSKQSSLILHDQKHISFIRQIDRDSDRSLCSPGTLVDHDWHNIQL